MRKVINKKSIFILTVLASVFLFSVVAFAADPPLPPPTGDPGTMIIKAMDKIKHLIWSIATPSAAVLIMITYIIQKFSFGRQSVIEAAMDWRQKVWIGYAVIMFIDVIFFFVTGLWA